MMIDVFTLGVTLLVLYVFRFGGDVFRHVLLYSVSIVD